MGRVDGDPLTLALSPPPNETPEDREKRLRDEARARKISEDIDEEIRAQKNALKKKPNVKVLLLGQSESGEHRRHFLIPHIGHPAPVVIAVIDVRSLVGARQVNDAQK